MYIYIISHDIAFYSNNKHCMKIDRTHDCDATISYMNTLLPTKFIFIKIYAIENDNMFINLTDYLSKYVTMTNNFFDKNDLDTVIQHVEYFFNINNINFFLKTSLNNVSLTDNKIKNIVLENIKNDYSITFFIENIEKDIKFKLMCKENNFDENIFKTTMLINKFIELNNFKKILIINDKDLSVCLKVLYPFVDIYLPSTMNTQKFNKNYKSMLCCKYNELNNITDVKLDCCVFNTENLISNDDVVNLLKYNIKCFCFLENLNNINIAKLFEKNKIKVQTDSLSKQKCDEYLNYLCNNKIENTDQQIYADVADTFEFITEQENDTCKSVNKNNDVSNIDQKSFNMTDVLKGKKYKKDKLLLKIKELNNLTDDNIDKIINYNLEQKNIKIIDGYFRLTN